MQLPLYTARVQTRQNFGANLSRILGKSRKLLQSQKKSGLIIFSSRYSEVIYYEGSTTFCLAFLSPPPPPKESVKYGVPQGSVLGPVLFSLFINDFPLHVKDISVDCDMLADDTTLHTSGKDMQIRSSMQDGLDQIPNWCGNNHMVINPTKTNL